MNGSFIDEKQITHFSSHSFSSPVYAVIGTFIPVSLWEHYMESRSIRAIRGIFDMRLLNNAMHRSEM